MKSRAVSAIEGASTNWSGQTIMEGEGRQAIVIGFETFKACLAARAYRVLLAEYPEYKRQFGKAAEDSGLKAASLLAASYGR